MSIVAREPVIHKRFGSVFSPPSGYRSAASGPEVTAEEILAGGIREDDWSFPVLLTTPNPDRVQDEVVPEGCDYTNYASAPIVYFDHQAIKTPIGKMRSPHDGRLYFAIEPGRGILGRIWIAKRLKDIETSDHARICRDMWWMVKDGLLNGISVGFDPRGRPQPLRGGGTRYDEWELLEVSLVGIPANGECRVIREFLGDKSRAKKLHPVVLKSLTTWAEPLPVWSPGGFTGVAMIEKGGSKPGHLDDASEEERRAAFAHMAASKKEGKKEGEGHTEAKKEGGKAGEHLRTVREANSKLHDAKRRLDSARESLQRFKYEANREFNKKISGKSEEEAEKVRARMDRLRRPRFEKLKKEVADAEKVHEEAQKAHEKLTKQRSKSMSSREHESAAKRERPHEFSAEGRREEAKTGVAEKNGSFPIENAEDLHNALRAIGRSKDPEATRRHISARAHELGLEDELPEDWHERGRASKTEHKSMSESSGSDGGYLTTDGEKHDDHHAEIKSAIHDRMEDHSDGDHGGEHEAHYHAETGDVHHVHGEEASEEHVKGVHADLTEVPGVSRVTHGTERPEPETGWELVYPGEKIREGGEKEKCLGVKDASEDGRLIRRQKAIAARVKHGQQVIAILKRGIVTWTVQKSTEDCVSNKIKYLHDSGEAEKKGWGDKQVQAIAYSYCGEKKGILPFKMKAMDDYETKEKDGDEDEDEDDDATLGMEKMPEGAGEEETPRQPTSVTLFETAIEYLEDAIEGLEPERREFVEDIIEQIRAEMHEVHPEEGGGHKKTVSQEAQEREPEEKEETDKELARYKSRRAPRTKGVAASAVLKRLRRFADDHAEIIRKTADNLHEVGDMHTLKTDKGMHIKGYTEGHHKGMRKMARALDRLHGAITKASEPEEDEKLTHEELREGGRKQDEIPETERTESRERDEVEVEKSLDRVDWSALLPDLRALHLQATGKTA
jgi:hypothetical protein